MSTNPLVLATCFLVLACGVVKAQEVPDIYHYARLETDVGYAHDKAVPRWDLDAWLGGDMNKLWLKSEGEAIGNNFDRTEFWGMYSRNIAEFWDAQIGLRQDTQPRGTSFVAIGVDGLAPYYFETEAHLFISQRGEASARIKERNDLLITQRLITQPYAEINLYPQKAPQQDIGAGAAAEFGIQTRYEFTRQFAPYIDLRYEDKFGDTASVAAQSGDYRSSLVAAVGLRLMY